MSRYDQTTLATLPNLLTAAGLSAYIAKKRSGGLQELSQLLQLLPDSPLAPGMVVEVVLLLLDRHLTPRLIVNVILLLHRPGIRPLLQRPEMHLERQLLLGDAIRAHRAALAPARSQKISRELPGLGQGPQRFLTSLDSPCHTTKAVFLTDAVRPWTRLCL